jgi:hypothetical protein
VLLCWCSLFGGFSILNAHRRVVVVVAWFESCAVDAFQYIVPVRLGILQLAGSVRTDAPHYALSAPAGKALLGTPKKGVPCRQSSGDPYRFG